MHKLGLRTRTGTFVGTSVLSRILHNPFYTGLIRVEKTGETYEGNHKPIVPVALFKRVQDIINGKVGRKVAKHNFLFRQLLQCAHCGRCLTERQNRLTDAYLDQTIDKVIYEERKTAFLEERRTITNRIEEMGAPGGALPDRLAEVVELAGSAYLAYRFAVDEEKRELVKKLSSNRTLTGKSLAITLNSPFHLIANRFSVSDGRAAGN